MSSFFDQPVSSTYGSILHVSGTSLQASTKVEVFDGLGTKSALSLGTENSGATITGTFQADGLRVGDLTYVNTAGTVGQPLVQLANKQLGFSTINSSILADLDPSPAGTYNDGPITSLKINSKGLVTSVTADAKSPNPSCDIDTHRIDSSILVTGLKVDKNGSVDEVYTIEDDFTSGFSYYRNGNTLTLIIPPRATDDTSGWTPLTLPKSSSSFPDTGYFKITDRVKAVTFMIKPVNDITHNGQLLHIEVTDDPNGTRVDNNTGEAAPTIYSVIYHKMPSSVGAYRVSGIATIPVQRLASGDGIIYFRNKTVGFPSSIEFSLEKLQVHY